MSGFNINEEYKKLMLLDPEDVGAAVLDAREMAGRIGFTEKDQVLIATVVSELSTNILRYATIGNISLRIVEEMGRYGIEVFAEDNGPGIPDVEVALQEHYSTTPNSLGLGLSSVRRIMDRFTIDSAPGRGTKVKATKWLRKGIREDLDYFCTIRAIDGHESESGDAGFLKIYSNYLVAALIDGVGHGAPAHQAAMIAYDHLEKHYSESLTGILNGLHEVLKGTRGAVISILRLNTDTQELLFSGIGNICTRVLGPHPTRLHSRDGIVGYMMSTPKEQKIRLYHGDIVMMTSDGIKENFDPIEYSNMFYGTAESVSRKVVANLGKDDDDASCMVVRIL